MILAVTPGDPDGIGPEIVWKAIRTGKFRENEIDLLCIGAKEPFEKLACPIISADPECLEPPNIGEPFIWLFEAPSKTPRKGLLLPGYQSGWSIEVAARLVLSKKAQALVTGPISKNRLQRGGFPFYGHTDFLAALCANKRKIPEVTMMLANDQLRVSLVTTHIAVSEVSKKLTRRSIRRTIDQTVEYLRFSCKINRPRIAVCALNPHAGEGGLMGQEEINVITPEIRSAQKASRGRYELSGPHPADTLFAKHHLATPSEKYDGIVCMYHDQGLIPVKLLDFPNTVNITLGLPLIRTSVDHGVGFDIAGKDRADPSSLKSAIALAHSLAKNASFAQ